MRGRVVNRIVALLPKVVARSAASTLKMIENMMMHAMIAIRVSSRLIATALFAIDCRDVM